MSGIQKKTVEILLYVVFAFGLALDETRWGFYHQAPLWTCVAYLFVHANIFHALLNGIALHQLLRVSTLGKLLRSMVVAVIAALLLRSQMDVPVVGFSGALFCLLAMEMNLRSKRVVASCLAFLALGFIIGNMAGLLHLYCFIIGLIIRIVQQIIRQYEHDCN